MPKRTKAQGNISMVFVAIDATIAAVIAVIWLPDLPDRGALSTGVATRMLQRKCERQMPAVGHGLSGRVLSCDLSTDKK